MRTTALRAPRALVRLLVAIACGVLAACPAAAQEAAEEPTPIPNAERRFDSEKRVEEPRGDVKGPGVAPHGPAMDGVRGSAIAPAPGAFGTDAGSPDDLRR